MPPATASEDDGRARDDAGQIGQGAPDAVQGAGRDEADRRGPGAAHDRERRRDEPQRRLSHREGTVRPCRRRYEASLPIVLNDPASASAPARDGIERADVFLAGLGFEPHRHDTYAIGITHGGRPELPLPGRAAHLPARPAPRPPPRRGARRRSGHRRRAGLPDPLPRARARVLRPRRAAAPLRRRAGAAAGAGARRRSSSELDAPLDELAAACDRGHRRRPAARASGRAEPQKGRASTCGPSSSRATTWPLTRPSRRRRRRSSRSPAPTASRSRGTSAARSARAPTATGCSAAWRSRARRSRAGARSPAPPRKRDSPTRATSTRQFKRSYGLTPAVWARLVRPR